MILIHKNAIVEITGTDGVTRACHLKEIKEVFLGNDKTPSKIDQQTVSHEDAKLIRDLMVNNILLKEAINC